MNNPFNKNHRGGEVWGGEHPAIEHSVWSLPTGHLVSDQVRDEWVSLTVSTNQFKATVCTLVLVQWGTHSLTTTTVVNLIKYVLSISFVASNLDISNYLAALESTICVATKHHPQWLAKQPAARQDDERWNLPGCLSRSHLQTWCQSNLTTGQMPAVSDSSPADNNENTLRASQK